MRFPDFSDCVEQGAVGGDCATEGCCQKLLECSAEGTCDYHEESCGTDGCEEGLACTPVGCTDLSSISFLVDPADSDPNIVGIMSFNGHEYTIISENGHDVTEADTYDEDTGANIRIIFGDKRRISEIVYENDEISVLITLVYDDSGRAVDYEATVGGSDRRLQRQATTHPLSRRLSPDCLSACDVLAADFEADGLVECAVDLEDCITTAITPPLPESIPLEVGICIGFSRACEIQVPIDALRVEEDCNEACDCPPTPAPTDGEWSVA